MKQILLSVLIMLACVGNIYAQKNTKTAMPKMDFTEQIYISTEEFKVPQLIQKVEGMHEKMYCDTILRNTVKVSVYSPKLHALRFVFIDMDPKAHGQVLCMVEIAGENVQATFLNQKAKTRLGDIYTRLVEIIPKI